MLRRLLKKFRHIADARHTAIEHRHRQDDETRHYRRIAVLRHAGSAAIAPGRTLK